MKTYQYDSALTFGKYQDTTLEEIFVKEPSYIDWCIIHLDHFYIDDETLTHLKSLHPHFTFSEEAIQKLDEKQNNVHYEEDDYSDWDDYEVSYEKYGGIYDLDDDFIDDVLDGDPDMYWNID